MGDRFCIKTETGLRAVTELQRAVARPELLIRCGESPVEPKDVYKTEGSVEWPLKWNDLGKLLMGRSFARPRQGENKDAVFRCFTPANFIRFRLSQDTLYGGVSKTIKK